MAISSILHPQGKQLLLCATFLQENSPLPLSKTWYIGLDSRPEIKKDDTLEEIAQYEPSNSDYKRVAVTENGGFEWFWQESKEENIPPEFTINATGEFTPNEEWGIVRNFFLTNVAEGIEGILVASMLLKKPRELDEETSLTVECMLSLSDPIE